MSGKISGVTGEDPHVKAFKGIPYAAPPVGELRWKAPQPITKWEGIKKCDSFSPSAMQREPKAFGVWSEEFFIQKGTFISEDCLYLNVWTAARYTDEKRPVIVYIHGGGFDQGSGSILLYNGESMAKKGIVFVTINYRLGVFGFLAHPELTKESANNTSGNYAILDQITALKWVKNNISAFGGDPGNVTIAGQSAGSMSCNLLAATPLSKDLFHKIIAESGAIVLPGAFGGDINLQKAEENGLEFAKKMGANSLAELRKIPAETIKKVDTRMPSFIIDGYVFPEPLPEIFRQNKQADVPLLTGYNLDDLMFAPKITLGTYIEDIKKQFGNESDTLLKLYPAKNDNEAERAQKNLSRDMSFGIQNYGWARIQSENCKYKAYLYFFERKVPDYGGGSKNGAFHSAEVAYAYDNLRFLDRPWEPADYELAKLMSSYWVNFATKGDPNGPGLPEWPSFNKIKGEVMAFDVKSTAAKHPAYEALEYFYQKATIK